MSDNSLWVEKYRPQTINQLTLPKHLHGMLDGIVKNPSALQNMIFYGPAGCSKTTTAKAIARSIGSEFLFINAALESGKETLREQIIPFATGISLDNATVPKIVILDEADRLLPAALDALKSLYEEVSATTRFILTSNNFNKIIEPLKSRSQCYDFSFSKKDYPYMLKSFFAFVNNVIFKEHNCEITEDDKKAIANYVNTLFPDLRRILNTFQSYYLSHGKIDSGICKIQTINNSDEYINAMSSGDFNILRKKIQELNEQPADFYRCLYENIDKFPAYTRSDICLLLAEYQYRNSFSLNSEINTLACAVEIMQVLTQGDKNE